MHPALTRFVEQTRSLLSEHPDEADFLPQIGEAMRELVAEDNWLDEDCTRPHPEHYQQFLLHAAPDDSFSVVSFVWGPGQTTPVHDHTVWGVIGVLRGDELAESFRHGEPGQPMIKQGSARLATGEVDCVSPRIGDIHKVSNAHDDRVSISIHAYGANIGKVSRHVFSAEDGSPRTFVSGYANVER